MSKSLSKPFSKTLISSISTKTSSDPKLNLIVMGMVLDKGCELGERIGKKV
jgi:hypothetical protein